MERRNNTSLKGLITPFQNFCKCIQKLLEGFLTFLKGFSWHIEDVKQLKIVGLPTTKNQTKRASCKWFFTNTNNYRIWDMHFQGFHKRRITNFDLICTLKQRWIIKFINLRYLKPPPPSYSMQPCVEMYVQIKYVCHKPTYYSIFWVNLEHGNLLWKALLLLLKWLYNAF